MADPSTTDPSSGGGGGAMSFSWSGKSSSANTHETGSQITSNSGGGFFSGAVVNSGPTTGQVLMVSAVALVAGVVGVLAMTNKGRG